MPNPEWDQIERRKIDREASSLTFDQHALRIAGKRFKWKLPEDFGEQQFAEGDKMKEAVRNLIGTTVLNPHLEVGKAYSIIKKQLASATELLTNTGLLKPGMQLSQEPSLQLIMQLLNLTPEQAQAILKMKEPRLMLELNLPFENYIETLDNNRMKRQDVAQIRASLRDPAESIQQEGIITWRPIIVEAGKAIGNPRNLKTLSTQVAEYQEEFDTKNLQHPSKTQYALMQLAAAQEGHNLDTAHKSILKESTPGNHFAAGEYMYDRILLTILRGGIPYSTAVHRPCVIGQKAA